jgi:hypothetical protein
MIMRRALDQPHAETRFQGGDPAAQRRFRRPHRASGGSETAMGHHLGKQGVVVEVEYRHRLI